MSEKIDSMAVMAEAMREVSDSEMEQVFGGQCHWEVDNCVVYCSYIQGLSYELCFLNGVPICTSGLVSDGLSAC